MSGPSRMLVVEPTGGLGNRMRVVDSAAVLAERSGLALTVVWTRTPDLNARFRDLFEPIPGVRVKESSWTASRIRRRSLRATGWYRPYLDQGAVERLRGGGVAERRADGIAERRADGIAAALADGPRPFVITCSRLAPVGGTMRRFIPLPHLRGLVSEIADGLGPEARGVHVRRGDHEPGLRSTTGGFLAWMQDELDLAPAAHFYLATDSHEEAARIVAAFPERVTTRAGCRDRRRPEGVRDAVVDLYVLARTSRIAGTFHSSFSETASELGGAELVVIGGAGVG